MRRRPQQGTSRGCSRRGAMSSRSSTSSSRRRSRSTASATRRGSTPPNGRSCVARFRRGATRSRTPTSTAIRHRDPTMMETLYWKMLDYLGGLSPEFVSIRNPSVLARFKKRHIHLLDSSTIQLVLNSIDWARHRARKAAAKPHPRPLEPIATTEDTGIILFRWFCLQQFFNFTHHRLHHTMPSTTTHVFYNIEPLPSQAEVLSFLWHFSDGCVRGADVKHLRSRDGRTRQARPSRWALC